MDCKGRAAPYGLFQQVFARFFQKAVQGVGAQSHQGLFSSPFLFVSFFFADISAKEKAGSDLGRLCLRSNPYRLYRRFLQSPNGVSVSLRRHYNQEYLLWCRSKNLFSRRLLQTPAELSDFSFRAQKTSTYYIFIIYRSVK